MSGMQVYAWNVDSASPLSVLVDSIEYVPLEAGTDGLFRSIDKCIKRNGKYFIFDFLGKNQVLVFDSCGKFLFPVGRKGHGPGEYTRIRNFTVGDEYIYLLNNDAKCVMIYDQKGNYIEQKNISFMAFDLAVCGNKNFLFSWHRNKGGIDNEELYKIILTDKNMKTLKKMLPIEENDCEDMSKRYYFTSDGGSIIFHTFYNDEVYQFNRQNGNLDTVYRILLPEPMIPQNKRNSYENVGEYNYLSQTPFFSSGYIVGQFIFKKGCESYIYHMNNRKIYTSQASDSVLIYMPLFLNDQEIISYLPSYSWYEYAISQGFKKLPSYWEEKLKEGEYILVKYKLKGKTGI